MNDDTPLLRQAHPNFVSGDIPTSQAFMPNSGDNGHMSVYDGDLISPVDSYIDYTTVRNKKSHSVWSFTCAEAAGEGVPSRSSPLVDSPAHSIVDFNGKSTSQTRIIAKRLRALAVQRGCQYSPV